MLAYLYDEALKRDLNASRSNYWETYIQEILDRMGARAIRRSMEEIEDLSGLSGVRSLVVGAQSGQRLTVRARRTLAEWVEQGGLLIGFAVKGLDAVFGIQTRGVLRQEPDDCSLGGSFELLPHAITHGIHPILQYEQKLLIFSDVQVAGLKDGEALARRYDARGVDGVDPAITWRKCGKGYAAWFAFDVPKTLWVLHQGRPIQNHHEGEGYSKTTRLQVIGDHSRRVLYSDEIVFLLQNMLARRGQPFIYQIPPDAHGRAPDALLFWGGDEYFGPTERSIRSSDWMRSKGLPYHVNIGIEKTPGKGDGHPMTKEEFKHLQDNGHEVSLYYMIYDDDNYEITPERIQKQSDMFFLRFGYRPVCTLHYNCSWKGWAEPARWMAAAGGKADNSFFPFPHRPHDHPMRNSPCFGFAQGTGYPFFFWDDADHGNERIPFIEQPVTWYELGHRVLSSANRPADTKTSYAHEVHAPLDMAAEYHLVINCFYHQGSISRYPVVREAIEEILRYIDYRRINVLHLGPDAAAQWWFARSAARVEDVLPCGDTVSFTVSCDHPGGVVMKALLREETPAEVTCDGQAARWETKDDFCGKWVYVSVPNGRHRVEIRGLLVE